MLNSDPNSHFSPDYAEQAQNRFWNSLKIKSPQQENLGKLSHNTVIYQSLSDTPRVLVSFPITHRYIRTLLKV